MVRRDSRGRFTSSWRWTPSLARRITFLLEAGFSKAYIHRVTGVSPRTIGRRLSDGSLPVSVSGFLIIDLCDDQCRWPIGEDSSGRHLFCGAPSSCGAYCADHAPLSRPSRQSCVLSGT